MHVNVIVVVVYLLPVVALGVLLIRAMTAPVSRVRLERFARRQQLLITPDNGNQVIRYLAVTRRWRLAGVVVALAGGAVWLIARNEPSVEINFLQLLAGWFFGALVAEGRLSRTSAGQRRLASLRARDASMYLHTVTRHAVPAALAISLAVSVVALCLAALGRTPDVATAVLAQSAAVAAAVLVRVVGGRILTRAQPLLAPDQLAADDAIRSRSLHALAGSGTALVLYAVISQLTALSSALPPTAADAVTGVALVLVFVAPLIGWRIATLPWAVRRGATVPPADSGPTPLKR